MNISYYETKIIDDFDVAQTVASEIKQSYAGPVGFDTETELKGNRRNGIMSTIQLYVPWHHRKPVCYIFHLGKMCLNDTEVGEEGNNQKLSKPQKPVLPIALKQILTSKLILKSCAAPENDVKWLMDDFGICAAGYIDIQTLAAMQGHEKLGLDNLAKALLPEWKEKDKNMTFAPWNSCLSGEMVEYAANDAYASLEILRKLSPWFFQIPPPDNACEIADLIAKVRGIGSNVNEGEVSTYLPLTYEDILKRCDIVLKELIQNPSARKAFSCTLAEAVSGGGVKGFA